MDDAKSEIQILEYLSECLRIFRKRLMQMAKLCQRGSSQTSQEAEQHFQKTSEEGAKLLQQFPKIISHIYKLQTVFPRFASRVNEIVNNTQLKSSSTEIFNYLTFLSSLLKQAINKDRIQYILQCMLQKSPKNIQTQSKSLQTTEHQYSLSQQSSPLKLKSSHVTHVISQGTQRNLDNYDKFIALLEKQYAMYKQMNLDQGEYRKKFFLARQDHYRKDTNLYEDMMFRNRFTREMLLNYRNGFERYCRKLEAKKNKARSPSKKTGNYIRQPLTNFTTTAKVSSIKLNQSEKNIEINTNGSSFYKRNKRMKTETLEKFGASAGQLLPNKIKQDQEKKEETLFPKRKKLKTQYVTCLSTNQFFVNQKIFQSEKPRIVARAGGNLVELKKINFLGSKIQLVPEKKSEKETLKLQKKKNLCKKTQQHFKRKISAISQVKATSNITLNTTNPMKPKSFAPLLIDYSRLSK